MVGVEFGDDPIDGGRGFGMFVAETMKEAEDDFFVAMTDLHAFDVGAVWERKTREAVCEEAKGWAAHRFAGTLEDGGQRPRGERVDVVCVANANMLVISLYTDLAGGEDLTVLIAEDGDEDFVLEADFR